MADDWGAMLICNKRGVIQQCFENACTALDRAPEWDNRLAFDAFACRTMLMEAPPWHMFPDQWKPRPWDAQDDARACRWMQRQGILVPVRIVADAVESIAHEREFHPVRDFLDGIAWDGSPRIDAWMTKYLGTEKSDYDSTVARILLIGAVARVRDPGVQLDTVPIFEGSQGSGKSSAIRTLFEPWMTDEISDFGSKDAAMQLQGVWCIEMSELDTMSRSEVNRQKSFISRRYDRFRPPFGYRVAEFPRQCFFVGTTNQATYFRDETGNRRSLPTKCNKIDLTGLRDVRDQLLAEADHLYHANAAWHIVNPAVLLLAKTEQADRYCVDVWSDAILAYIDPLRLVTISDILEICCCIPIDRQDQTAMNRVARVLCANDWERFQKRDGEKRTWAYRKATTPEVAS